MELIELLKIIWIIAGCVFGILIIIAILIFNIVVFPFIYLD